ncbi:VanZ family protein [Lacticaseibacillus saniviri]|uniref:Integral membrane protein n=1 Tax=Lacticaseibacillus saniviri JCM 17471 = DSM 24301 TaxID=1293598 RepID=A0A0R2MSM5_9LACO|nr:VanZ family protein [Lacticaseibacillus saniviri]KRO16568.1 integral membrane protein [Lacticaseibacillus saniviri JCM 17471 = DSM 24301]MCG4280909.1 VanZ family protein [Lacticaseibacillus saniviri]
MKINKWLVGTIAVLLILFISSSMTYHQQTSVPFLERMLANKPLNHQLLGVHFKYAGEVVSIDALGYFKFVEFFIRKAAHFISYFAIGVTAMIGLAKYTPNRWVRLVQVPLSVAGVAALDEFHQMLTGDRTPLFQDVMLDTIAGTIGVLIVFLVMARHRKSVSRG